MSGDRLTEVVDFLRWIDETCEGKRGVKPCCEACTVKAIHAKTRMFLAQLEEG